MALTLKQNGIDDAYALEGGYDAWIAEGGRLEPKPAEFGIPAPS